MKCKQCGYEIERKEIEDYIDVDWCGQCGEFVKTGMKLSIIIPIYNEESTIKELIRRIKRVKFPIEYEIVAVDDESTDSTAEILKKIKGIKTIFLNKNNLGKGKGRAVMQGLLNSTGNIFAIQDADLEYSPENLPKVIKPILQKKTDVVYGTRLFLDNKWSIPLHYIGNKFLTFMANLKYGYSLTDIETGCKCFNDRTKTSLNIPHSDFRFEIDFLDNCWKNNLNILEMPISYNPRKKENGKKINWFDGVKAFVLLMKRKKAL